MPIFCKTDSVESGYNGEMAIYLHDIPLERAQAVFSAALDAAGLAQTLRTEHLPLAENLVGRTLSVPIWAKLNAPHYHASAMDGFAIRAVESVGATQTRPIQLSYGEQTIYVDTGDPLPDWADAVIPIEQTESLDRQGVISDSVRRPHHIQIREAVPPWRHVRPLGEDMVATQLVLPAQHTLRPVDLGAIAGCGHHEVTVAARPKVAIIPTGTELVAIGQPVSRGDIIEYNALMLAAQVREWGGEPTRYPITADDIDAIRAVVQEAAATHDLVLLNAGSSAGSEDYSATVIAQLGQVLVHGIAVRPGHPVILGMIKNDESQTANKTTPIIGVPGYPVSAALTGEIFVRPLLAQWQGKTVAPFPQIEATLTRKMASPPGDDDYVRVAVGMVNGRTLAAPLTRGAGVISSLVNADGLVVVPAGSQGLAAGSAVQVNLLRGRHAIANTILAIGSHDMTLDVLNQLLAQHGRRLASANVGSLGGLVALKREEAHLAGAHLLDPETGVYNKSYIDRYLPDVRVRSLVLVGRQQGLIVQRGNPKQIAQLADLAREDVRFVNRQRGAGTRVLLDYQLALAGIDAAAITGYEQAEYTHLAVAAAVLSGRADCGLGIAAAAHALDLAFIPLFEERYDLIIPAAYTESDLLRPLITLVQDQTFADAISTLAGYNTAQTGTWL